MAFLLPCPACARHVRRTESACPFCACPLAFVDAPAPRVPTERLGRAATFAFGAVVATTATLSGCSGSTVALYGAPAVDSGQQVDAAEQVDGGTAVDAAQVEDAGEPVDAATPVDAFELDTGGSSSDYGAPPPP